MAVQTTSIVPFPVTSIPERLTAVYVADKTVVTAKTGTAVDAVRLNRLQSADFNYSTPVTTITEMGTQTAIGGIDDLGEVKFKLDFAAVGINQLAAVLGVPVGTGSGDTTTIALTQFQTALVDIFRLVADPTGTIFKTQYMQDCVVTDYTIDARTKGFITHTIDGMGPNMAEFPGYIVPKTYLVQSADVSAGYITCSAIFGSDEAPVEWYQPTGDVPPSYWTQNGMEYFFKIEIVPGANLASTPVRFYEQNSSNGNTASYDHTTTQLTLTGTGTGYTLTSGDLLRIVYATYNTDSFPKTIPLTTPDTTDRPAIPTRIIPITINAANMKRIQSASIKYTLKRDQVQGVGENTVIYGVPAVPQMTIDLQLKESDTPLLTLLTTGQSKQTAQGGTIIDDALDPNYATRAELATAYPFEIIVNDPFDVSNTLLTVQSPQLVTKGFDVSSTQKADNTIKVTAEDVIANLQITYTVPS